MRADEEAEGEKESDANHKPTEANGRQSRRGPRRGDGAGWKTLTAGASVPVATGATDVAGGDGVRGTALAVRQERALTLLCQGVRAAAIAQTLGTTPSTVRRWLRKRFETLAREAREEHGAVLLRAIEGQREIARAAWESYHHERDVEAAILRGELDFVRRRASRRTGDARNARQKRSRHDAPVRDDGSEDSTGCQGSDDDASEEVLLEEYERPRHPSQGARYLAVALAAQREMARLQGLYDAITQPPAEISITITRRPDGPENIPPGERPALPSPLYDDDSADDAGDTGAMESEGEP